MFFELPSPAEPVPINFDAIETSIKIGLHNIKLPMGSAQSNYWIVLTQFRPSLDCPEFLAMKVPQSQKAIHALTLEISTIITNHHVFLRRFGRC